MAETERVPPPPFATLLHKMCVNETFLDNLYVIENAVQQGLS